MYGKAACPVPRGAGDSTGVWKRSCGTTAKAGGNGENKLLPAITEGSYLLERSNRALSLFFPKNCIGKLFTAYGLDFSIANSFILPEVFKYRVSIVIRDLI
jgi:hypothetical protein